jgi:hypothetical protein
VILEEAIVVELGEVIGDGQLLEDLVYALKLLVLGDQAMIRIFDLDALLLSSS